MRFFATAALAGAFINSVVAAPADLQRRTDYEVCKKSDGWHKGGDCPDGDKYICSTVGLLNLLNCVNVLNGNEVKVPIDIIIDLKARNTELERRTTYDACYSGGKWKQGHDCAQGDKYVCSTIGLVNLLNCVNILNNNVVVIPINLLVNLKARSAELERRTTYDACHKDGKWYEGHDCDDDDKYVCSTVGLVNVLNCVNLLNNNVVVIPINVLIHLKARSAELERRTTYNACHKDGKWYEGSDCDDSDKYVCRTVGLVNVLNCVNVLNNNVVVIPINVLIKLTPRNAEIEARSSSSYEVCKAGSKYYWGNDCDEANQYTCTTAGLLNILNCVNILNGNTVKIPILAILDLF